MEKLKSKKGNLKECSILPEQSMVLQCRNDGAGCSSHYRIESGRRSDSGSITEILMSAVQRFMTFPIHRKIC